MISLEFVKKIDGITEKSVFYALIKVNNEIIGFGRQLLYKNSGDDYIKKVTLNETFDIIEDNNIHFTGEDPRAFYHNDKLFVVDNYFNKIRLYNVFNQKYIPVYAPGKNFSFVSHNNELYFIHVMRPFYLLKINLETTEIEQCEVNSRGDCNGEYRGGTPGYKLTENIYYGFGHRTYHKNGILTHDIFYWNLDFTNEKPDFKIVDIDKPSNALNICDPTSIIEVNGENYMITAESERDWGISQQDFITNVYKLSEIKKIERVFTA